MTPRASRVLHELHVLDGGKAHAVVRKEGVAVVADVEEGLWNGRRREKRAEGSAGARLGGGEGQGGQGVHVNEVDVAEGEDVDGQEGDGAVTAEVDALEVDV